MCGVTKVDCLISCRGILSVKLTIFEPPPQKKMKDFGSHDFFGEVTSTWPFTVRKKRSPLGKRKWILESSLVREMSLPWRVSICIVEVLGNSRMFYPDPWGGWSDLTCAYFLIRWVGEKTRHEWPGHEDIDDNCFIGGFESDHVFLFWSEVPWTFISVVSWRTWLW